ncbi:hypothetical protein HC762_02045, partial [bacterium]|nr:hypothetical protein [bacterium]
YFRHKNIKSIAAQYRKQESDRGFLGVRRNFYSLHFFPATTPSSSFLSPQKSPQTDNARQVLLAKSDTIRSGLINSYLSNYRYLSSVKDNNHIEYMYGKSLDFQLQLIKAFKTFIIN